jgi:hypothetical protein
LEIIGGKALKNTFTRRYERQEFEDISSEIISILAKDFKKVGMPLFYHKKETFGDVDIVVSMEDCNHNIRDYIEAHFQPNEIFKNGNCWSFDYKELQIDFITTSGEHFDSYLNYLNYNDLGNFIGKIAMGFGCRYGQEGLWLEHYFKGTNLGKIMLSKDTKKIFEFLDLSYNKYVQGFEDIEELFVFISNSRYFNWEKVQLENNNKVNRDRDKKRNTYQLFLKWIDANVRDDAHNYQTEKDKTVYYDMIANYFPEAQIVTEIRRLEYEYCKDLYIKSKFNGGEVMRRFGIDGKILGDKINLFRKINGSIFPNETFEDYVLKTPSEEIYDDFSLFIKT